MALNIQQWAELLASEAAKVEYKRWKDHPVTIRIRLLAQQFVKPGSLKTPNGEEALYSYGMVQGASVLNDLIFELDKIAATDEQAVATQIDADYDLQAVLAAEERPKVEKKETRNE